MIYLLRVQFINRVQLNYLDANGELTVTSDDLQHGYSYLTYLAKRGHTVSTQGTDENGEFLICMILLKICILLIFIKITSVCDELKLTLIIDYI